VASRRRVAGQQPLFGEDRPTRGFAKALENIIPFEWPNGIKPWDPIDKADEELGWEYRWVDHRRAVEIRLEIEAAHGHR
jgi:hypothetical protein